VSEVPTLYERSRPGRQGVELPEGDLPEAELPAELLRGDNGLPELSQQQVVRHYLALSQRNFGVDTGFYPLGSCTMKYNPKVSEMLARLDGFVASHPLQPVATAQGNLELMYRLQRALEEIGGFSQASLQPAAGAQGELTALLMMRAYHAARGEGERTEILIPDSAHGTNPASTAMAGFDALEIPSDGRGNVDLNALRAACGPQVAGLMITNPNTLGLFEERIEEVIGLVHECGALVYGDGANMNALCGVLRPGELGIDVMHFNLHKTFGTPHGGGGPGSGPLGASARMAEFLPGPVVACGDGADGPVYDWCEPARSIGPMTAAAGNFGLLVRALAYVLMHGAAGLRENTEHAVLNANYLLASLRDAYPPPVDRRCMHELVLRGQVPGSDVRALDISKRLMDYGFHPPTNYFPLIVPEALMIEPTETETLETLDAFAEAMRCIAREAVESPELLHDAPVATPVRRLDEVRAARQRVLVDPAAD
jgi:glycine dehydrogenase subunit 2